ncbi:hypothetical protein JANAI62_27420 [Jannaschia pagri]|uniref:DfsB family protein n=1 Tax=Jannaschia pagri TaxID=2829797 RepID=A0ABQ4NPG6_9RHOB|nr:MULTISPECIES: ClbS/DfsB family four-helix bundle protein [unclassified Jannaschia]GIT92285.1 hypothetical protein JANAI61_27430 [Jannaschia sp. AI_61]GIT96119.1 hypothetical protein JANAI62_27420 [Jannaschia sp. AI_62]
MPATTKAELLSVTDKEYSKLTALIGKVDPAAAFVPVDGEVSIKDVIAHRAHWIDLFLGWYADGQAGRPVFFPAEGYKWSELKRYNADLRLRQSHMTWSEAVEMLVQRAAALRALIAGLSEDALYGGPMKGAKNTWTTGRWAEASGSSHYRSAAKFIRAALRSIG